MALLGLGLWRAWAGAGRLGSGPAAGAAPSAGGRRRPGGAAVGRRPTWQAGGGERAPVAAGRRAATAQVMTTGAGWRTGTEPAGRRCN